MASALPVTLVSLELGDTGCGDIGMAAIAGRLPALTALERLSLGTNPAVAEPGWQSLGAVLSSLSALQHLDMRGCGGLADAGLVALSASLPDAADCRLWTSATVASASQVLVRWQQFFHGVLCLNESMRTTTASATPKH